MNERQRVLLSEKLLDLANLIAAALVFGQIVARGPARIFVAALGLLCVIVIYLYSLQLIRR